jgi:hypothetical protein
MEEIIMDTANQEQQEYPLDDEKDDISLEAQRSILRQSLDETANAVRIEMNGAGLSFPFGMTVPESGLSLVTMVTPVDPSDEEWSQATTIVCQIVAQKLGGIGVRCRPLPCVMVNPTMMAAEVVSNTPAFDTRL